MTSTMDLLSSLPPSTSVAVSSSPTVDMSAHRPAVQIAASRMSSITYIRRNNCLRRRVVLCSFVAGFCHCNISLFIIQVLYSFGNVLFVWSVTTAVSSVNSVVSQPSNSLVSVAVSHDYIISYLSYFLLYGLVA